MKIVAVDPGFAKMGIVVVDSDTMIPEILKVIRTKKSSKKAIKKIRVADDDCRRLKELQEEYCECLPKNEDYVIAVETFSCFKGGYKAGMGYAMAITVGNLNHMPIFPFVPQDIKRGICGKVSASKKDVQDKVFKTFGINENDYNKGDLEHIADALGLAILAKDQIQEYKKIMGK